MKSKKKWIIIAVVAAPFLGLLLMLFGLPLGVYWVARQKAQDQYDEVAQISKIQEAPSLSAFRFPEQFRVKCNTGKRVDMIMVVGYEQDSEPVLRRLRELEPELTDIARGTILAACDKGLATQKATLELRSRLKEDLNRKLEGDLIEEIYFEKFIVK